MKRTSLMILVLGFCINNITAQGPKAEEKKAKKIAYLSSKLELTPIEAEKFWPIYNEADEAHKKLRKEHKEARPDKKISEMTDVEVEKLIDQGLEFQQQELDLKKKYHEEFKKVLPVKKVAKLIHFEHEYRKQAMAGRKKPMSPGLPGGPPPPPHE